MSNKKNIKKKIRKPPRKCTICAKIGHNTRTCPTVQKIEKTSSKLEKKDGASFVIIKVGHEADKSPFVLDISTKNRDNNLEKVDVYKDDKKYINEHRNVVSFADIITKTNNKKVSEFTKLDDSSLQTNKFTKKEKTKQQKDFIATKFKVNKNNRLLPKINLFKIFVKNLKRLFNFICKVFTSFFSNIALIFSKFFNSFSLKRFTLSFVVLTILITIPLPALGYYKKIKSDTADILQKSTDAFLALQSSTVSAFSNNLVQAESDLNSALNSFGNAEEVIDREYKAMVYVAKLLPIIGDKVKSRQKLLLAGHELALGNTYLVKGIDEATQEMSDKNMVERLTILQQHLRGALDSYETALVEIDEVDIKSVPVDYQQSFSDFKMLFAGFVEDMKDLDKVIQSVQLVMGGDGFKRYLIVFQNNFEMRPTGGFIGSYAVVDVQSGKILNIEVPPKGSYDFQGQLDVYEKPPLPLQLINKRWEFQDSNWFPDFETSAKKMSWFFEHGKKVSVDGVIAINSSVLSRLLKVVGPIENDNYALLLESENALENLEKEIRNYDNYEENNPKEVLSQVLDQILESLQNINPNKLVSLVKEMHEALSQKEIQLYFNDSYVQNAVKEYGWTGEILATKDNQDYLMVVNANIGGEKSDFNIRQTIEHQAVVSEDGSVIDTVVVTRKHLGQSGEKYFDDPNINYLRVYVPEGSELLDAGGFVYPDEASFQVPPKWYEDDVDLENIEKEESIHLTTGTRVNKEFDKTSFGNWIVTKSGEESKVYFVYKLPFSVFEKTIEHVNKSKFNFNSILGIEDKTKSLSRYSVLLQKQSGMDSKVFNTIIYPDVWSPIWKEGSEDWQLSSNGASIEENFDNDKIFGIVMEEKN